MQDTLSDMLVRIKNAQTMSKQDVLVINSKFNSRICDVLTAEGFLERYESCQVDHKPFLKLKLKYYAGKPVISGMKRVSKSSQRVYQKSRELPNIIDGFGIIVLSTSKGVMSHLQAKKQNLGGEVLFWVN
jgi:small subunit ribosomal protein S8